MKTLLSFIVPILLFSIVTSCAGIKPVATEPKTFQVVGFEIVNGQKVAIVKPVETSCEPYEYRLGEIICSMPVKVKQ